MNGKPGNINASNLTVLAERFLDTLKGSYYANINPDIKKFSVSLTERQAYPEYYGENICACLNSRQHDPLIYRQLRATAR